MTDLFRKDWNLNTSLKMLFWDGDLALDKKLAIKFMGSDLPSIYNL